MVVVPFGGIAGLVPTCSRCGVVGQAVGGAGLHLLVDLLVAVADRKGGRKPMEGTPNHFEKLLERPCLNHAFLVKHLLKDCNLMWRFLS